MSVDTPPDRARHYTIWLGGARVGMATEREHWTPHGVELARTETLRFLRGETPVELVTTIAIDASPALVAERVRWTEAGGVTRAIEAVRTDTGWQLSTGEVLPGEAVPAELVPLVVRRDGHFEGPIVLPARGFAVGDGRIEPVAPGRLIAHIALQGSVAEATIDVDRDGSPARVVDGEGVIALRATEAQIAEPFAAVDLIAATSVPITGARRGARIILDGNVALPALPGQRATPVSDGIELDLERSARTAPPELRALVTQVRARITPTLGAGPASTRDAANATAGDCTTFALAYAALATARGIPTRVVTGVRIDHATLVRHRWAVSWDGAQWVAVDAAFDRVPAGGDLIGLAVHDADDAGLVAGEAALAQLHAARWAP